MKVTFIRPNLYDARSFDAMEPLCFAYLKGLTPNHIETELYDERLEEIPFDIETDLIAMTVETYTARRAYQIADEYRRRNIKVIMGGYHPTFLPDETLEHADTIVLGDAEGIWDKVLSDYANGKMGSQYQSAQFSALEGSQPDRSIYKGKKYAPTSLVQYGRGCKFNCDFCSIRAFYGSSLRQRHVEDVVEDIIASGRKFITFVDDNIFVNVERAKELFEALIPLNIKWFCQVSIDILKDSELVKLMARSGCISVLIGFESLNQDSLKHINKGWNLKWKSYDEAITLLHESGIMLYGTFILGCDGDTVDDFAATADFAIKNKFYLANFNPLTPTPGARLYDRMEAEGKLLYDKWWLDPNYKYGHATYRPECMTPDELTEGCFKARKAFNSIRSITSRMTNVRANLRSPSHAGIYLLSNYLSRREIHNKQARHLGATT